jgi:hypothetical protein
MRREDWPVRLYEVVEAAQAVPYQLGVHDCLKFACECCAAMTGRDYWPTFAGRYTDLRGAVRVIAEYGSTFVEAVGNVLDAAPQPVLMSQRGDVVMYRDDQFHLGVCMGATVAVLGPDGLLQLPITHTGMVASWRID